MSAGNTSNSECPQGTITRSLYHPRHKVQPSLNLGCNGLKTLPLIFLQHLVFAQAHAGVAGVRHRLDPARIDGLELFDQPENSIQLALCDDYFRLAKFDASKHGDTPDLIRRKRHKFRLKQWVIYGIITHYCNRPGAHGGAIWGIREHVRVLA